MWGILFFLVELRPNCEHTGLNKEQNIIRKGQNESCQWVTPGRPMGLLMKKWFFLSDDSPCCMIIPPSPPPPPLFSLSSKNSYKSSLWLGSRKLTPINIPIFVKFLLPGLPAVLRIGRKRLYAYKRGIGRGEEGDEAQLIKNRYPGR